MIDVKQLKIEDLQSIVVPTIRTNKKHDKKNITYLNIESAFDIETSSVKMTNGDKSAFMYIWMFGIGHGNPVYYGRTWEEFQDICKMLQDAYNLSSSKRLVIYVHNLGYEFQFMRKYFEWVNVFSAGERKPLKALCTYGIEFRDSYILSGYSLAKTAENLMFHDIKKMTGDLDYKLVRTKDTTLTDEEMMYCNNDIEIITAYIKEQIDQYSDISKIPLTNTGRVRSYVRDNCYYTNKNHSKSNKGKYYRYRNIMKDLTVTVDDYKMLKQAFMGGFTHANAMYSGALLENVRSIDFTSSYPAVMLAEKFPMSRGKEVKFKNKKEFEWYCQKFCMVFEIRLLNVRPKITQENYISASKCTELKGAIENNGRVHSADELAITITETDWDIIKQCYEFDNFMLGKAIRYHKAYLPKAIIESIMKLYEDKTVLKGVEGKEVEYLLSKGMLNSVYGMCVTDIVKDEHTYLDEWGKTPANLDEQILKYNESKNRFLYYPWGVWVTAYARKNLWTGILAMKEDYVYSDTDSIKCLNYERHQGYIKWYNETTINKLYAMCDHYKLDKSRLSPKNKKGQELMIGIWDDDGTYDRFKTLGAKRYLVEYNDNVYLTVAGLSKRNGIEYMKEKCEGDLSKVFEMFNNQLYIPAERTGKSTHTYVDKYMEFMIKDFQGNETKVEVESGIHLEDCDFTLSLTAQYGDFLEKMNEGYIFKGVKFE